ncbi:sulfotransferase family 2 domain-containing protein [Reichenbachiella sp.]|uniref:sulfotransferase family 2 domain-containing protein n=1 Tax=Reichenbachiella sp. TaxID=2184521 RepID=UPI003BB1B602
MVAQHKAEALRLRDDLYFRKLKLFKYRIKNWYQPHRYEWSFVPFYANKCIFVHIPKAAGIAISQSLFNNLGGGHETIRYYQEILKPSDFDSFFKFTIVRNPWDRLYSAYEYLKQGGFGINDKKWFDENIAKYNSFENFVMNWLSIENCKKYIHFLPQKHFIENKHGQVELDFVGNFETIQDDFSEISKQLKRRIQLKHINSRKVSRNYKSAYTKGMIEKVREVYSIDLEVLNYGFE